MVILVFGELINHWKFTTYLKILRINMDTTPQFIFKPTTMDMDGISILNKEITIRTQLQIQIWIDQVFMNCLITWQFRVV